MASDWHLVLSRDATILAAGGGVPQSCVGGRIGERDDLPDELKVSGLAVLAGAARSAGPVATSVTLASLERIVHLTVVDAVPLRRGPTDVRDLLDSTLDVLRRQAKALDVTLSVAIDDDVPRAISIDGVKIGWAVTVLAGNALRYVQHGSRTMPGGSIAVRVTRDPAGPAVAVEVADDGCGIPRDRVAGLFAGVVGRPRAGLGLPMVAEVVAAHGGHIDLHSETDGIHRGTTVRFTLPVS